MKDGAGRGEPWTAPTRVTAITASCGRVQLEDVVVVVAEVQGGLASRELVFDAQHGQALGGRFTDAQGIDLPWGGAALAQLAAIDLSQLDPRLAQCRIKVQQRTILAHPRPVTLLTVCANKKNHAVFLSGKRPLLLSHVS